MTNIHQKQTLGKGQVAARIFFLVSILILYSLLHLYIFSKVRGALAFGTVTSICLGFFMTAMVGAPVLVHVSERYGLELFARLMSYLAYTWMGLAFLFFFLSLAIDLYRLLLRAGGLVFRADVSYLAPSPQLALIITLLVTAAIASYGFFEARSIRTEKITIRSPKIPKERGAIKIAQISDVHLGLIVREKRLKRILREVNRAEPDILVCTGDLVDGQIDNLRGLAELLQGIAPQYGKFAVTGNHEFFAGLDQALLFAKNAGFTMLRGEAVSVAGILNIAGIDDPTGKYFGLFRHVSERDLLSGLPADRFTLLLKHMPVVNKNALGLFDLQLSGHTHNGQIFPFNLVVRLFFPRHAGLFHLPHDALLYVSRGSGTWGPPIRFLSPPEVTVIELVHKCEQ
jgi:predicted MPP superfamily phosphohydrolase